MNYTKEQIMAAIRQELVETYGGLSRDHHGNVIDLPYQVLGVVSEAFKRLENSI